jgi:hypothetical protein
MGFGQEVLHSMSSTPAKIFGSDSAPSQPLPVEAGRAQGVIAWSSFLFAFLQSICTFFVALGGLRLLIGVTSVAVSATMGTALERFHTDWIRIPMMGIALIGSLLNLAVLYQIRRLRNRPAAQWRRQPLSRGKVRMERIEFFLSIAALALIGIEEYLHFHFHHHL